MVFVRVDGAGVEMCNGVYEQIADEWPKAEYARRDGVNRVFCIGTEDGKAWHLSQASEEGLVVLYKAHQQGSEQRLPPCDG